MKNLLLILAAVPIASAATVPNAPVAPPPSAEGIEFFEKHIRPVLAQKCYSCHSAESNKSKGNLLLDTRDAIRAGGDTGHAVVPGNVKDSELIKRLHSTDKDEAMPPTKEGGPLAPEVIAKFEQWIQMGAPDPRDGGAKSVGRKIDVEEGRKFWAFQPVKVVPAPSVKDAGWARSETDKFLLAAMEGKGIKPVADADKPALLRRVYFDIVGLPPTPEELDAFVKDEGAGAFAKVVERLLAMPQFGERWGRHWLDVARYAESTGKERNFTYPEAWRYRDWVIASLNADKPYERFIREQIAGDLLPHGSPHERDQHLIATGFLAMGPKGLNEKNKLQFTADLVDEQIDVATRAVLATTVACARCHDHKFDPIAQKDYYAMAGIFRSTETFFGTAATKGNRNGTRLIALSEKPGSADIAEAIAAVPEPVDEPAESGALTAEQTKRLFIAARKKNPKAVEKLKKASPKELVKAYEKLVGAPAKKNKKDYAEAQPRDPNRIECMGVLDGKPTDARIYVRGEVDQPGDLVPRGFAPVLTTGQAPVIAQSASGRAELAEWLVKSPLTSRVMVNRVWQHLFGEGIVATEDNFGATGEKPSHPELLDALAARFEKPMTDGGMGWSVKGLIRELVLTRAYGLGSAHDSFANEVDPGNRLHWRQTPRRLDAESIRDAMLASSGQLDLTPAAGSLVSKIGDAYVGRGVKPETFTNYETKKRSVYLPIVRDNVAEVLELFDFAEPSLVIAARDTTNVPSQALYLMNNAFVRDQSLSVAKRILAKTLDFPSRVNFAYELVLGRSATPADQVRAHKYLLAEAKGLIPSKGDKAEAAEASWATFCQALFASAEFRYLR